MTDVSRSHLLIRLKRASDGSAALSCVRADGSTTWQRQRGATGAVMPAHDLTHYAVESVLGYRHAFYGLVADGWDIDDFAAPYPRGPIPEEAREAEVVVGVFDTERMMGGNWSPTEVREQGRSYVPRSRPGHEPVRFPELSDADIERIHAVRAHVFARWAALAPGETLELRLTPFSRTDA